MVRCSRATPVSLDSALQTDRRLSNKFLVKPAYAEPIIISGYSRSDGEQVVPVFYYTTGYTFAGMYDALQAFAEQISGATGIPLIRLLGQSPKGFSSGESDLRTYYDTIATLQDDDLRPALEAVFAVLSRHLWGEALPDGFSFEFESLMQPTETDKAQIATADAQAVAALVSAGILSPARGLESLRDSARLTGRFANVTDADIQGLEKTEQAPPLPGPGSLSQGQQ